MKKFLMLYLILGLWTFVSAQIIPDLPIPLGAGAAVVSICMCLKQEILQQLIRWCS